MATETHGAEHSASSCIDGGGSAIGMPQLCGDWFGNQIFWLLVALAAIYFVLSRVALPRIAAILAERQGTITNAIASAEDFKSKAAAAEDAYNQALAEARIQAQAIATETKAQIQADLNDAIAKADAEISAKTVESEKAIAEIRAGAMASVKDVAKDTTKELVSALGGKADAKTITAAVTAQLKG